MKHKMPCQGLAGCTKRGFPLSLEKRDGVVDPVVLKTCNRPFCNGVSAISQEVFKEMSGLRDPKGFFFYHMLR